MIVVAAEAMEMAMFYTICVFCTVRVWYVPYAYGMYHTRMVHTIRVWPYAYGMYHTRMVCTIRVWYIPYAYGTIFRTIRVRYGHTRMVRTICVLCLFSVSSSLAIT